MVNFSENSTVRDNIISNSSDTGLYLVSSGGNEIYGNTIKDSGWYGIHIREGYQRYENKFYHNNFFQDYVIDGPGY